MTNPPVFCDNPPLYLLSRRQLWVINIRWTIHASGRSPDHPDLTVEPDCYVSDYPQPRICPIWPWFHPLWTSIYNISISIIFHLKFDFILFDLDFILFDLEFILFEDPFYPIWPRIYPVWLSSLTSILTSLKLDFTPFDLDFIPFDLDFILFDLDFIPFDLEFILFEPRFYSNRPRFYPIWISILPSLTSFYPIWPRFYPIWTPGVVTPVDPTKVPDCVLCPSDTFRPKSMDYNNIKDKMYYRSFHVPSLWYVPFIGVYRSLYSVSVLLSLRESPETIELIQLTFGIYTFLGIIKL